MAQVYGTLWFMIFFFSSALWEKASSSLESVIGVWKVLHESPSPSSCALPNSEPCLELFLIVVKYLSRFPLVPHAWKNKWAQHLSKQEQNKTKHKAARWGKILTHLAMRRYLLWRQGSLCSYYVAFRPVGSQSATNITVSQDERNSYSCYWCLIHSILCLNRGDVYSMNTSVNILDRLLTVQFISFSTRQSIQVQYIWNVFFDTMVDVTVETISVSTWKTAATILEVSTLFSPMTREKTLGLPARYDG